MIDTIQKIAACLVTSALLYFGSLKMLGALQQSCYKGGKFFGWLTKKSNLYYNRLTLLSLLCGLSVSIVALCFSFLGEKAAWLCSALPFALFLSLFVVADAKYALKVPLKKTGRIVRLSAVYLLFLASFVYLIISACALLAHAVSGKAVALFAYVPVCFVPLVMPLILAAANAVTGVFENARNRKFVKKAKEKLAKSTALRVVVVGSYGKTSVKNILSTMLAQKYRVAATPASYNTPMGVALTVFGDDFDNAEVFVAEVGARRKGDVKELCEWIKPDFAAFTGVCNQHVETFGSLENVIKTKSEVFDFAPVVVCGEGLKGALAPEHASKACFVNNAVKNLQLFARETRFTLVLSGGEIDVCTKLLGEPAAENIALCATVCEKLGLSLDEIKQGVQKLDYIPHRLQLIEAGGAYILDDGYNANPKGAFEGIKALKRFEQRKVIVTPGIVETGVLEEQINADLGAALVGLDLVLLVGDTLVAPVKNGYLAAGGNAENLRVYPTLDGARNALEEYLQAGDAVLFLNDLPDVY